jgi:hypothetical protein
MFGEHKASWSAVLVGLVLFVTYEGFLRAFHVRPGVAGSFYGMNAIREEQYCFVKKDRPRLVLVGSSLTGNIAKEMNGTENLGFPFSNALTGLRLVVRGPRPKPLAVVVEINEPLLRGENETLTGIVDNPITRRTVSEVRALRISSQPVNLLRAYLSPGSGVTGVSASESGGRVNAAGAEFREERRRQFSRPMNPEEQAFEIEMLHRISAYLEELRPARLKVFLHSIPMDDVDRNSIWMRQFLLIAHRELVGRRGNPYRWLDFSGLQGSWRTVDGLHLVPEDARAYAQALKVATDMSP